jgi:flavin-dependent dehydrogenase
VAGQVKPTTGGGIYYALRCADIAGDVLGAALATGDLSAGSLKPYEERWKGMLGRELRIGYVARRIYEQLGARELDSLLLLTASNGLLKEGVKFDWHADLVSRALGYRLFENILGPFARMGRRVDVGADD